VFTLSFPGCPGPEFVVCTPLTPGCPDIEPVPPPRAPRSCPRDARPRVSVSRSAKLTPSSSFPENRAGSIHGPRSHEAHSTSQLPARSIRPHCTGRPYSNIDLQPRFPRAKLSTSEMGRPHHEIADDVSVARRAINDLTARSSRARAASPPGFPGEQAAHRTGHPNSRATAPPGFPNGEAAPAARVAHALEPTPTPRLPEASTLAPSHGLLERWNLRPPLGCPSDDSQLHCADPEMTPEPSHGCPRDDSDLTARMPMLEALASCSFPREAFPRPAVTCGASGLRCDVLTAELPLR